MAMISISELNLINQHDVILSYLTLCRDKVSKKMEPNLMPFFILGIYNILPCKNWKVS